MQAHIHQLAEELYQISLPVPVPGFEDFINAWADTSGPVVIVDVGPAASAPLLLQALADLEIQQLDYILLTHIHIDHAGAIGEIAAAFPRTPIVCHPKAIDHLKDPSRLWQGSLKTLGALARKYGPIAPVAARQIECADRLKIHGVLPIETLGHAPHHYSYLINDRLFAGEASGVCLDLHGHGYFLRPATPPRFFLETSLQSIERLISLQPNTICFGHACCRQDALAVLKAHHEQLQHWYQILCSLLNARDQIEETLLQTCLQILLAEDPLLSGFSCLSPVAQQREQDFLLNSIQGFLGYIREEKGGSGHSRNAAPLTFT